MHQPLWQNLVNIIFIGFVLRHAAMTLAYGVENTALRIGFIAVCVAAAVAAVAIWGKRLWVIGSLLLLAGTYTLTLVLALVLGPGNTQAVIVQLALVLAATAGLVKLAQREPQER